MNIYIARHAVICADSFHVTKHLTEDFHDIRMRCYKSTNNASLKYLLQKFKYIFYHNTKLDGPGKYNRSLKRYATTEILRKCYSIISQN